MCQELYSCFRVTKPARTFPSGNWGNVRGIEWFF